MTEYPPASEAMDAALGRSIDALRGEVTRGFDRVENHISDMVTKGQFDATVARLDAQDKNLDDKLDRSIDTLRDELTSSASKTRQVVTWGLSIATIVSGVVFGVINSLN